MRKFILPALMLITSTLSANWTDKVTLNGYFNFEFEEHLSGFSDWPTHEYSSFDSDMVDLVLNVQATDRLRLAADFTWEHGSQSEVDKGNVGYEYAFAEYTLSDSLRFRAGKMFIPFGIYNEIHTAKPSTIIVKEPNPTNKMYYISSGLESTLLYPRWGTGIALLGNSEIYNIPFDYIVQITNGDISYGVDKNQYDKDDNNQKAIAARIRMDLTDNLQIGASFYHDKALNYESVYETKIKTNSDANDVNITSKAYVPVGDMVIDSQGIQMIWHINDDIRLEMEYMTGTLDVEGSSSFRRSGFSILPSYFVSENINLYFLYSKADPNHSTSNNSVVNYAPGVNIEIDHNMFLKADLYNVESNDNNLIFKGDSYREFRVALAIGF